MLAFDSIAATLRDLAARHHIHRTDRLVVALRRDAVTACIFKWSWPLGDLPELWSDDLPTTNADGVPADDKQRRILLALAVRSRKVNDLAVAIDCSKSTLYESGALKALADMSLIELAAGGYRLTSKGRRVAAMIDAADEDDDDGERMQPAERETSDPVHGAQRPTGDRPARQDRSPRR